MSTVLMGSGAIWVIATGVWFGIGGFAAFGFPGMAVYVGVCGLGGLLSGRFLST
jgi:hypothetical protein